MQADISIVTPVRNLYPGLLRCMASLDGQREDLSLEHVVVDAGTDLPPAGLCRRRPPETIWIRDRDRGIYDALNKGIRQSSAPIIGQLNADEQSLPGSLKRVQEIFQKHPRVDLVFGDYLLVNDQGRPLGARREIPARYRYLRNGVNYLLSCTVFFRRELWLGNGEFDSSLRLLGDKDWYLRALEKGALLHHEARYLALFALGRGNASRDRRLARREQELVRRRHGGASASTRLFASLGRWTEKLLRGCYGPRFVRYVYCHEDGRRETVSGWTGCRWQEP